MNEETRLHLATQSQFYHRRFQEIESRLSAIEIQLKRLVSLLERLPKPSINLSDVGLPAESDSNKMMCQLDQIKLFLQIFRLKFTENKHEITNGIVLDIKGNPANHHTCCTLYFTLEGDFIEISIYSIDN